MYRTNEYTHTLEDGKKIKQKDEIVHVKGFTLKGEAEKKLHSIPFPHVYRIKKNKLRLFIESLCVKIVRILLLNTTQKNFNLLLINVLFVMILQPYLSAMSKKTFFLF